MLPFAMFLPPSERISQVSYKLKIAVQSIRKVEFCTRSGLAEVAIAIWLCGGVGSHTSVPSQVCYKHSLMVNVFKYSSATKH